MAQREMTQDMMDAIVFSREKRPTIILSEGDTILTITVRGKPYKLTKTGHLGKGGNCTVFKYEGSGLKYALRTCEDDDSEENLSEELNPTGLTVKQLLIRTETKLLTEKTDKGTVQYEENTYTYIMECYDMDLTHYLFRYKPDRETKLRILNKVRELVFGLAKKGLYYMDLKPDNILCNVKTTNTIDIDSIVLGDIGSLNDGGENTLISTYPPPESYTNSRNKGFIYLKRFSTPAVEHMLSYLMGIMIVALFRSPHDLDMLHFNRMTGTTIPDYKLNVLKSNWNSFENYLNNNPVKRKSIYERMTVEDLPDDDRFITATSQRSRSPVGRSGLFIRLKF